MLNPGITIGNIFIEEYDISCRKDVAKVMGLLDIPTHQGYPGRYKWLPDLASQQRIIIINRC